MLRPVEHDTVVAGRYTLERCISTGGTGALWLVRDEQTGESCALRLADGTGHNVDVLELASRYRVECEIIERIRCENVVDVMDYGNWNGIPYLVSEYLQGEDLATRIRRDGELSPERAYRLLAQAARALARAHVAGIVHGDVTPENILITTDGAQAVAKIYNFSLTQRTSEKVVGTVTRTGSFLRLPHYASPEQAAGAPIDARSDLWSLGVIAFECLTGKKPFDGHAFGDLVAKIMYGPVPELKVGSCNLPAALDAWWGRACARDPVNRFQSAKQLCDSLGQVFDFPLVYVPESNSRATTGSSASLPAAMLGTPEQSQIAQPRQSFPKIPRRSTPLGMGAVNPNLISFIPPPSGSADDSHLDAKAVKFSTVVNAPDAGLPSAQVTEVPSSASSPSIAVGAASAGQPGFLPSEALTISRQPSKSSPVVLVSPSKTALGALSRPARLRVMSVTLVALLICGSVFVLRAWLRSGSGTAASTALSDGHKRAGDLTNLLSPPPSASPAAEASPIVPKASNDNPTSPENAGTLEDARLSAPSLAESVGKQLQQGSTKRALRSAEASNPRQLTAMAKPDMAAAKPDTLATKPAALSKVPESEKSTSAPSTMPVKPAASTTVRDYGI